MSRSRTRFICSSSFSRILVKPSALNIDSPGLPAVEATSRSAAPMNQDPLRSLVAVLDVIGALQRLDIPGVSCIKQVALVRDVLKLDLIDVTKARAWRQTQIHLVSRMLFQASTDHGWERYHPVVSAPCRDLYAAALQVVGSGSYLQFELIYKE